LSSQHVAGDLPNVHAPDRDVDGSPATFKSSSRAAPLRFTPLVVPQCPLSRAANADRSDRQHAQGKQPPCGAAIANGTFSPPGFRLRLGHKDAAAVGGRVRPKRPDAVRQPDHGRFTTSLNKGRADLDWSALTVEVSQAAGLT
jgi:hypothetical protein